jgi:hypothetical protein
MDEESIDEADDDPEHSICQCELNATQPLVIPEIQII